MSEKTLDTKYANGKREKEQTFLFTRFSASSLCFALLFVINKVGT